jgi:hypothetical protein
VRSPTARSPGPQTVERDGAVVVLPTAEAVGDGAAGEPVFGRCVGVADAEAPADEPVRTGSELRWVLDSPLPHAASAPAATTAAAARAAVRGGVLVMS